MIAIISPHLYSIDGTPSPNIGDQIIYNYLAKELKTLFPAALFYDFPLHASLNRYHRYMLAKSDLIFVTGSNFLTPRISDQRKALISIHEMGILNKVIFMGGGWSGSENLKFDAKSIELYKRLLHRDYPHSVRDSLSLKKFSAVGFPVINTSCPTMWALPRKKYNRVKPEKDCLFTLTDYGINIDEDQNFLSLLLEKFTKLYYFPQGRYDMEYLTSLTIYKNNSERFLFIDKSLSALNGFINSCNFTYVGTRLHCGIHVLNNNKEALILEVDNRARYISEDTKLPVCKRGDSGFISSWLDGNEVFGEFSLPNLWNKWRESFKR